MEKSEGSARSRSDETGTVGTGEAVGAGVAAVDGVGRGRGTCGGVLARGEEDREAPPSPKLYFTEGGALPVAATVGRRIRGEMGPEGDVTDAGAEVPKLGRGGHSRTGGRGGARLLSRTP